MFDKSIYVERRKKLKENIKKGILVFFSNDESPMSYKDNPFHYRQDSSFLYYFGLDEPRINAIIDLDSGEEILFGDNVEIDDIIWMGPQPTIQDKAAKTGIDLVSSSVDFEKFLLGARNKNRTIHYLPPYRAEHYLKIMDLLGIKRSEIDMKASQEFIIQVIKQRSVKSEEEINEIETAHAITYEMHTTAMKMAKPGVIEQEIAGVIEGIALSEGASVSFPIILSIHGETLHNHFHNNRMNKGDLLINDSGAESNLHYAADITRTIPVSGKFTEKQKQVYEIVLNAQESAIKAMKTGIRFLDIHLLAASVIAEGMKNLGLIKGSVDSVVEQGAHALFFPHGLGHMMGLDVHDMENLGEDFVGYDQNVKRSKQFGLAYLRFAKKLMPGYVLTVEPGIYFIPELIDLWRKERKFKDFLNYDEIEKFKKFGGIRIEDDVLVTDIGHRILGKTIPKSVKDVESMCRS
jgi:Xaa-Pro dipeptidase